MVLPLVLSLKEGCVRYNDKIIFQSLDFNIHKEDRIALVGNNGAGKTTLMHVITAEKELDEGERWQALGTSIGYLKQDVVFSKGQKVADYILEGIKAEERELKSFRVEVVAEALQIDPDKTMDSLSGGQIRRAALAKALVEDPDILLLDEPTNHLDLEAIEWLENYLCSFRGTLVCVSHDRMFLSNISNKIFWLDRGEIKVCPKGFSYFEEWSSMLLEQERRELRNRKQQVEQEVAWAARSPQGRRKRNIRRLEKMKQERERLKLDQASYNRVVSKIALPPPAGGEASSKIVAEFFNVTKIFEEEARRTVILERFNMRIMRGDRVGILGKNGSGKTTFLRLLIGELKPDTGKVKVAKTTEISYFDQKRKMLNPQDSMWKTLCPSGGDYINVMGKTRHVCGYLKDFMFDPANARNKVSTLSGGEKNRLMLAKVLAEPGNLLILDEPTNDLDMDTLDMLEEILLNYSGTLFVVSHDRDFLDQTVTKIIAFEGDGMVEGYIGGYSDYLEATGKAVSKAARPEKTGNDKSDRPAKEKISEESARGAKVSTKMTYKLQHELKKLPEKIASLEKEVFELNEKLSDPDFYQNDPEAFNESVRLLAERKGRLEIAENRWLELEEMKESTESR
jgi:ATP-binding cassette subfamily F protein uup